MDKDRSKSAVIGSAAGFINGLFGAAGGTILVPGTEKFLKYEPCKAHATAIAIVLPMSVLSGSLYVGDVHPDIGTLLFIVLGGVFGGAIGAKLLKKIAPLRLKQIFGIFMCIAAVKMIL